MTQGGFNGMQIQRGINLFLSDTCWFLSTLSDLEINDTAHSIDNLVILVMSRHNVSRTVAKAASKAAYVGAYDITPNYKKELPGIHSPWRFALL